MMAQRRFGKWTDIIETKQHDDEVAAPFHLAVFHHVLLVSSDDSARLCVELFWTDGYTGISRRVRGRSASLKTLLNRKIY